MKTSDVFERLTAPVSLRRAWLMSRAWMPDERVAHLALDLGPRHERRHRVEDDAVDAARADERLGDLEGLLAGVGLADQELVDVDPAGAGVARVEGMLDVDEGGHAAACAGPRR